jgi:type VI secretion system protein ImpM
MLAGFYGKIPTKGDFVQRSLNRAFTNNWDNWLQGCMDNSRAQLGADWLAKYLVSPLWRFALPPGIFCDNALVGVIMPSVDSVGRHFPLTLALELPPQQELFQFAISHDKWFEGLEDLALFALDPEFSMQEFERRLEQHISHSSELAVTSLPPIEGRMGWLQAGDNCQSLLNAGYAQQLSQKALTQFSAPSLWWTAGSETNVPAFIVYEGLPPQREYASFLTGDWSNG